MSSGEWDGDLYSSSSMYRANDIWDIESKGTGEQFGGSTLISNRSRVYKGGGWDDRAYYLVPGQETVLR